MDAHTPSPPAAQRLALALHRATALVDRVADAHLRPVHGIGISTFAALVAIDAVGPASQSVVARALNVSRPAVTQQLARLVGQDLVEVAPDPSDSRANLVALTPVGARLLGEAWDSLARSDDGLERGIDMEALLHGLEQLVTNAERHLDGQEALR